MAKVSFTKLGLKKNQEIKTLIWNDQIIEIKQYLSMQEKLQLISKVINLSYDKDTSYANPIKIEIYTKLNIVEKYTNITFTDKQKEDVCKLYDLLMSSTLLNLILQEIPEKEILELVEGIQKSIESIYTYQNSMLGILENVSQNYQDFSFNSQELIQDLADSESISLLKEIAEKFN